MKSFIKIGLLSFIVLMSISVATGHSQAVIDNGKKVKFDYTLKVDGKVVETSVGQKPIEYTDGEGKLIPGLESQLKGMKVGDEKAITVEAKDGYGVENPEAFQEVSKTIFPQDFKFEKGMIIELQNEKGETIPATVWEVKTDTVLLNFNHPLAGKTLQFDVKIVSIE